jgi:O-antigen ligase
MEPSFFSLSKIVMMMIFHGKNLLFNNQLEILFFVKLQNDYLVVVPHSSSSNPINVLILVSLLTFSSNLIVLLVMLHNFVVVLILVMLTFASICIIHLLKLVMVVFDCIILYIFLLNLALEFPSDRIWS